jgi:hypothetical protein
VDIHKPKPVHSLREFLSELGVIVLGVLIALAAEQAVETLHWRHEVADAREAMAHEITANLRILEVLRRQDQCRVRILAGLDDTARGGAALDLPTLRGRPPISIVRASAWDVAKTGQIASHFPLQERLRYARLYDLTEQVVGVINRDREAWSQLTIYLSKTDLDAADRKRLAEDVAMARYADQLRGYNLPTIKQAALDVGVTGPGPQDRIAGIPDNPCELPPLTP